MTCMGQYSRDTFWKEWQNLPTIKGLFTLFLSLRALKPVITDPRHTHTHTNTSTMFFERENTEEWMEFNREKAGKGNESFH